MSVCSVVVDTAALSEHSAFHNVEAEWVPAVGGKINALESLL